MLGHLKGFTESPTHRGRRRWGEEVTARRARWGQSQGLTLGENGGFVAPGHTALTFFLTPKLDGQAFHFLAG